MRPLVSRAASGLSIPLSAVARPAACSLPFLPRVALPSLFIGPRMDFIATPINSGKTARRHAINTGAAFLCCLRGNNHEERESIARNFMGTVRKLR